MTGTYSYSSTQIIQLLVRSIYIQLPHSLCKTQQRHVPRPNEAATRCITVQSSTQHNRLYPLEDRYNSSRRKATASASAVLRTSQVTHMKDTDPSCFHFTVTSHLIFTILTPHLRLLPLSPPERGRLLHLIHLVLSVALGKDFFPARAAATVTRNRGEKGERRGGGGAKDPFHKKQYNNKHSIFYTVQIVPSSCFPLL